MNEYQPGPQQWWPSPPSSAPGGMPSPGAGSSPMQNRPPALYGELPPAGINLPPPIANVLPSGPRRYAPQPSYPQPAYLQPVYPPVPYQGTRPPHMGSMPQPRQVVPRCLRCG